MLFPSLKFLTSLWLPAPYLSKTPFPTLTLWTTHDFVILPIFGQKVQKVGRLNTVGFLYKNSPQTLKSCSHAQQKAKTHNFGSGFLHEPFYPKTFQHELERPLNFG
jgi:hypothetical protein